jgi:hypothetical protein
MFEPSINCYVQFVHTVRNIGSGILVNEIKQLKQKFYSKDGTRTEVGLFSLGVSVDHLFFIGAQLVALSPTGI